MQFKSILAALPLLAFAAADVDKFVSDLNAYYQSLGTDSSFINIVQGLATVDSAILESVQALATANPDPSALLTPPSFVTALPSPYDSVFMSLYSHEMAIASSDGVLSDGKIVTGEASVASSAAAGLVSSTGAIGSLITSAASVAGASGSAATASAASASAAKVSTGGAASPTGMIVMGGVAGAIGVVAALL